MVLVAGPGVADHQVDMLCTHEIYVPRCNILSTYRYDPCASFEIGFGSRKVNYWGYKGNILGNQWKIILIAYALWLFYILYLFLIFGLSKHLLLILLRTALN